MDWKYYRTMIENEKPSPELIRSTKEKMERSIVKKSFHRGYTPILIACILLVAFTTTAFAYGDEIVEGIKRLIFGDSTISQTYNTGNGMISLKIINRSEDTKTGYERQDNEMYVEQSREVKFFPTYEKANEVAPFHIKKPGWIPEKTVLKGVNIIVAKNKKFSHDVIIDYASIEPNEYGQYDWIKLKQYDSGPDARLEIKTMMSVDKVQINDIEGSCATDGHNFRSLYWVKDGIVFELQSLGYDMETLIAIAESL